MKKLRAFVDSSIFQNIIIGVIVFNSILMGLATSDKIMNSPAGQVITILDYVCLGIFVVELLIKIIAYNKDFLKDGWNIFDFLIIAISFVPNMRMISAFRVFRVLRVLKALKALKVFRMVSGLKKLRIIVSAIFDSIPGILWTGLLLLIDFYIFAILGTSLFGQQFPDWFGSIGKSLYTLFQVMTLESWSMGISRPVMEVFSWAWVYFVPFVVISAFIVMNVVVGIVVNTISEASAKITEEDAKEEPKELSEEDKNAAIKAEIASMKEQLDKLEKML